MAYHSYTLWHMEFYVRLVLCASVSLRGASRVMGLVSEVFQLGVGCPSWSCGRLWLLRLGYFKLTRAKEAAGDWAWIIDHTVQVGSHKCFVILGLRLSGLPAAGQCLSHEDVEPIAVIPGKDSSGEIVFNHLEEAVVQTGVPRQIIGDHGTDLVSGMEKFCRKHPQTCSIYDIKHKTAALLKRELKADERWQSFIKECSRTARRVRQTDLAPLMPPNQRTKARYMNIDVLIRWGLKALAVIDAQGSGVNIEALQEKVGWIKEYRRELAAWEALWTVAKETESFIRARGLYRGCHRDLKDALVFLATTEQSKRVRSELISFVAQESLKAKAHERLLGSSEVIESVFGKLKYLEKNQANSGFTALLLSLAAMVSTTTREVVRAAMETVRTKDVLEWCRSKLGTSVQARKRALSSALKEEQKPEEFMDALAT